METLYHMKFGFYRYLEPLFYFCPFLKIKYSKADDIAFAVLPYNYIVAQFL